MIAQKHSSHTESSLEWVNRYLQLHCTIDFGSAGGRSKNLRGAALKDLDWLERLVNPHCIESGKIWGAMAPLAPSVPPALCIRLSKPQGYFKTLT